MGTPLVAKRPLEELVKAGHEVVLVVTQEDKPNSRRGNKVIYSPVKQLALDLGIEVFQPKKVSEEENAKKIIDLKADAIVVCAFGQLLKKNILSATKYGCLNIHASLLPKYRGAAPVNRVIIDGEEKTGICIMQMDEGLDTGDIILEKEILLDDKINSGLLFEKISEEGSLGIVEALELLEKGEATFKKQEDNLSTYANKILKEECRINWAKSAREIHNLIRGLSPIPTAFTYLEEKQVKILESKVINEDSEKEPGTILGFDKKDGILVATARGIIGILSLKMEGKRQMNHTDFWAGNSSIKLKRFN